MKPNTAGAAIVFLLACLVYAAITFPLVLNPLSTVIGSGIDPFQYIWNADVFAENVKNLKNPFYTNRILYPEGTSLWMHTYTPIIGMVNVLVNNPFLSVALSLFLSFGFSAAGSYLLARHFNISHVTAAVIGLIYAFSPYKTAHLTEHHHLLLTAPVPFFILFFIKAIRHLPLGAAITNQKNLLVCLLLLVVTFFSDYYTAAFLFIFSAVYLIWPYLMPVLQALNRKTLIVALVLVIPAIHFLVKTLRNQGVDDKGGFYNSADLAGLLIPPEQSWLYHFDFIQNWRNLAGFKGPNEQVVFLGLTLFLLIPMLLSASQKNKPHSWIWGMVIVFALLSFPKLKFLEFPLGYSPLSWIHQIPFLNHIRNPGRYFSMVYLFLPLALAIKAESSLDLRFIKAKLVQGFILGCILLEFVPVKVQLFDHRNVPVGITSLAKDKQVRNILMIPDGVKDGFDGTGNFRDEYLLWSTLHKKNSPGGYISRLDSMHFTQFKNDPVLAFIGQVNPTKMPSKSEVEYYLKTKQIDAILIHPIIEVDAGMMDKIHIIFDPYVVSRSEISHVHIWKIAIIR